MKYVCLIYSDEKMWPKMSKSETDTIMAEYNQFTESIRSSGHYVAGEALQGTPTATSLRSRSGKLSTTDGPFAETKEQLGGFYLIEAKDLNEATRIASRIPGVKYGCIEVRPVVDFSKVEQPLKSLAGTA